MNRPDSFDPDVTNDILAEMRQCEKRLRDGEEFRRTGRRSGVDPEIFIRWESAWIDLLHQYERLCEWGQQYSDAGPLRPTVTESP